MRLPSKPNVLSTAVVIGLVAVLVVLAVLQYQGSRQVSDAASARMKASLHSAMNSFRLDLVRELASLCLAFQTLPDPNTQDTWSTYAQQYEVWTRSTSHPELVSGVYILEGAGDSNPRLLHLNPATNQFEAGDWPPKLGQLPGRLAAASPQFAGMIFRFNTTNPRGRSAGARAGPEPGRRRLGGPWAVEQNVPALLHMIGPRHSGREEDSSTPPRSVNWILIELDSKVLTDNMHELADRFFGGSQGLEYNVAVLGGNDQRQVVFSSDPEFGKQGATGADATMELFGGPLNPPGPTRGLLLSGNRPNEGNAPDRNRAEAGFGLPRLEPVHYSIQDKDWLLVVKHRKGSLDAVVAGMRRRSLAINFGVLLVLAATMGMIIVASQRAHRLAKLQMDFVTGVSHELRTPLAVINSAAENIADGVVGSKQQMARYGAVIKKQTRQLTHLVEQILLFAATRQNGVQYTLQPLEVAKVIDTALNDTAELVRGAGFTVQRTVEPNLPRILGDLPGLSHCLQNLITNAVKYGGQDRWIGVRAYANAESEHVLISVDDHGAGIEHGDLQRIFEPFYRTAAVRAAQIHGSGLGLPLAKSIAEAMGGTLTATSERGKGSSFTLHLCVANEPVPGVTETVPADIHSSSSHS